MDRRPGCNASELDVRFNGLDVREGDPYTMDIWDDADLG